MDKSGEKVLEDVKNYGWHVAEVYGKPDEPLFAYTIGLYQSFNHPEIIMFGLSFETMYQILKNLVEEIKAGTRFETGKEYPEILEGYKVAISTVEKKWYREYLGQELWFYAGDDFPTIQCVWPDKHYRYPWHEGAEEWFKARQPILS